MLLAGCGAKTEHPEFIEDRAGIFSRTERRKIDEALNAVLNDLGIRIQVVILADSPDDLNATAAELFERLALGAETGEAKGVLFLIDPVGEEVRIEIGYALEATFPDAFVSYLMHKQMLPFFASKQIAAGIAATVELLVGQAFGTLETLPDLSDKKPNQHDSSYSGGAGAKTAMTSDTGRRQESTAHHAEKFLPQASPLKTLEVYKNVLAQHIKDPELPLYTPETRKFFAQWLVTDAQQDNELKGLQEVFAQAKVVRQGNLAVARFPLQNRQAAPYMFRRSAEGWMLDFAAMNRLIGFNHANQWFFRVTDHEFMFAFKNVRFDQHGFPHQK